MLQKTDRDECEGKVTRTTKEREKKKESKRCFGVFFFLCKRKTPSEWCVGWVGKKHTKKNKDGKQIESNTNPKKECGC